MLKHVYGSDTISRMQAFLSGIGVSEKAGKISKRRTLWSTASHTVENIHKVSAEKASATCKSPQSPHKQKFRQDRSKEKVMLEMFFDIHGIVHLEFIPEGHAGNKELYVDILSLRESIRKKRPKLWAEQSCILLRDTTPADQSLLVTDFLTKIE
ncbi:uncharacterized protein TNCV_2929131 [Trichonephila clavipes]|nr:uncharacterized protein TNCV_2929131 [Trichonephila clavipes]